MLRVVRIMILLLLCMCVGEFMHDVLLLVFITSSIFLNRHVFSWLSFVLFRLFLPFHVTVCHDSSSISLLSGLERYMSSAGICLTVSVVNVDVIIFGAEFRAAAIADAVCDLIATASTAATGIVMGFAYVIVSNCLQLMLLLLFLLQLLLPLLGCLLLLRLLWSQCLLRIIFIPSHLSVGQ